MLLMFYTYKNEPYMRTLLLVLFFLSGTILIGTVMLMTPKGGLGVGMWGIANAGEYGSKKSLEGSLQKIALFSSVIFVIVSIILPYTTDTAS